MKDRIIKVFSIIITSLVFSACLDQEIIIPPEEIIDQTPGRETLTLSSEVNDLIITLNWQSIANVNEYVVVISGNNYPYTEVSVGSDNTYQFTSDYGEQFNIVINGFDNEDNLIISSQIVSFNITTQSTETGPDENNSSDGSTNSGGDTSGSDGSGNQGSGGGLGSDSAP